MTRIQYKKGDVIAAAKRVAALDKMVIIPHVVNSKGAWGAGFVLAVSKAWPEPKKVYNEFIQTTETEDDRLGIVTFVNVEKNIIVANMCAQTLGWVDKIPPIRYEALEACLSELRYIAKSLNAIILAPKFGAGLAGGNWSEIEQLITEYFEQDRNDFVVFEL